MRSKTIVTAAVVTTALALAGAMCYTPGCHVRRGVIAEVRYRDKEINDGSSDRDRGVYAAYLTPVGAVAISGDPVMVCPNQIALCKLHDCSACEFNGLEENCPLARSAAVGSPTFQQLLDAYSRTRSVQAHKRNIRICIKSALELVGLGLDSRAADMSRPMFRQLTKSLVDRGLSDDTIISYLSAFRSIASEQIEPILDESGLTLPTFSIPKYERRNPPRIQEVSDRTIRKVEIQMERWLMSGTESDRSAFLMCFFALYCGMRGGDICRAKWDILQHTSEGVMIVYTPHKTAVKTHGRKVAFRISNKVYVKVEPFIGPPSDYVIPRHPDRAPKHVLDGHGEYAGMHRYIRQKVNKALLACGIGTEYLQQKKLHALRKYFATERALEFGKCVAANDTGDNVKTLESNYIGTHYGKVA